MNSKKTFFIILFLVTIFGAISYVKADVPAWLKNPLDTGKPTEAIESVEGGLNMIISGIIMVAQVVFIIMLLVGGIMYLTAAGDEGSVKKARNTLISAIVGIVITLAAWPVSTWVLDILKTGQVDPFIEHPTRPTNGPELPEIDYDSIPDEISTNSQCRIWCDYEYLHLQQVCRIEYEDSEDCEQHATDALNACGEWCDEQYD